MKLVDNWKKAWRWVSMQLMSVVVFLPFLWDELPVEVKSYIPDNWLPYILAGVALLAMIGRMVDQGGSKNVVAEK